jgi:hypothetical protein
MFIYTLPRVPGAAITTRWEEFCHSREGFVVIEYDENRSVNRWNSVPRKRKFGVTYYKRKPRGYFHTATTWCMTLEQAERVAAKIVAEKTAGWAAAKDDGWVGRLRKEEQ